MRPLLAASFFLLVPVLASAQASTLKETYRLALENSDSIAISAEAIRQAEDLYRSALGGSFPQLSFRHTTAWQDRATASSPSPQSDGMIRLSQSGLSGYRELYDVKAARATAGSRTEQLRRARQLLLGDVASAFYGLLQARENAAAQTELLSFADRRLAELHDRVRVGRASEADAIEQELQASGLRSQLEESARLSQARADLLAFLARAPVQPNADEAPSTGTARPLQAYLDRLETRPDVAAARRSAEASKALVQSAKADYLPELSWQANRYGYRPAVRSSNKWDASVAVDFPIFSFGATRASVDAAASVLTQQEYALRAARRAADLDVRNAFRDQESAARQLGIQRRSLDLAERDYQLQTRNEKRGLVTSLEVLTSLDRLNGARLSFNTSLLQARLAAVNLEIASGADPENMELLR